MNNDAALYLSQIASNPLVQDVPRPFTSDEWTAKLLSKSHPPTADAYDQAQADHGVIDLIDTLFVATPTLVAVAVALHKLLWDSLVQRDPRFIRINGTRTKQLYGGEDPIPIPIKARGLLLKGITHLGKSTILNRFTDTIEAVIDRRDFPDATSVRQIVWLRVAAPQGSSTTAFVNELAKAIDHALGTTDHRAAIKRRKPADAMTYLIGVLEEHYCGLLIIEEGQSENRFEGSRSSSPTLPALAQSFMHIMNSGIGLVLAGNPMAFDKILSKGQMLSRLASNCFELHPAISSEAEEWRDFYLPGIWSVTCFQKRDQEYPEIREKLYAKTGGFHHALIALRKFALLSALEDNSDHVRIKDIEAALNLPLGAQTTIINAFAERQAPMNRNDFTDIPWDDYELRWNAATKLEAAEKVEREKAKAALENLPHADDPPHAAIARSKTPDPKPEPAKRARTRQSATAGSDQQSQDVRSPKAILEFRRLAGEVPLA